MTDREFDQMLYQGANELPPDQTKTDLPTPWREALIRICWGLGLNFFTLNFFNLQYILPTVGVVLVLLGFRSLRRENRWFRMGFALSLVLTAVRFAQDILLATPLSEWLDGKVALLWKLDTPLTEWWLNGGWLFLWGLAVSLVTWLLQFALWRGLKEVFRKAEQPPKTRAAGGLVIWYGIVLAVALLGETGGYIALFLLIIWLIMLRGLFKISRCLDQAGYAVTPAPVWFSNGRVMAVSLLALLAAVVVCLFLFSRYPVSVSPAQLETGRAGLRAELVELGFPEDLLADLTDEEVGSLEGAYNIQTCSQPASALIPGSAPYDSLDSLSLQLVQIQLPEDSVRYYFWFSWEQEPSRRLRDGIEIVPTWHYETIYLISPVEGRLLWEEDGQLLQSPLTGAYGGQTRGSVIWGNQYYQACNVNFSLPKTGERIRGYVSYTARVVRPTLITNYNAEARYIHQELFLSYPWSAPCQYQREISSSTEFFFSSRQHPALFQLEGRAESEE